VSSIRRIIVSTDCKKYQEIALSEGVEVNDRPSVLSGESAVFNDFVRYIANEFSIGSLVWCPVTAPLIDCVDYEDAISKYSDAIKDDYDSLITVNKVKRYLLDENGPLNFRHDIGIRSKNSLPILYEFVNGISIAKSASMSEWGYNWGQNPFKFILPVIRQVDICDREDYQFARFLNGDFS
jgi:N-acylneuraminate cytidylyltransferase